jgi:PglZ domain.
MPGRLINKIAQMVTVDYCRLTFVENPDGFLLNDDVCRLLQQVQNIEIVKGSQLTLRIHFELNFKQDTGNKYVYICDNVHSLLPDMAKEGVKLVFLISDVFPLFADKSLVRKQTVDVLEVLYSKYAAKRIPLAEGQSILNGICREVEEKRRLSVTTFLYRMNVVEKNWNKLPETIHNLSTIIEEAINAGIIDELWNEIGSVNQRFQQWIDQSYFSTLASNALIAPKSVNRILPHLKANYHQDDKLALVVVDGICYWQYLILKKHLSKKGYNIGDNATVSWLPSITMLSRQAIFRGEMPKQDYLQNPQNEVKLWKDYWKQNGFSDFEIQYLYNTDEFIINDGVKRLAYVTVEMDEKMHSASDLKELHLLTEYWCTRIVSQIDAIINKGYTIYLTTDHGNVLAKGWRSMKQEEKVYLFKDGSRGARHLIYTDLTEQNRFVQDNTELNLLRHDKWLCIRDDRCFANAKTKKITHGGSHFMEVAIPFIKITK